VGVDYVSPEFGSVALITVDVQVDTLDGQPLEVAGTSAALPAIAALAAAFRAAGRPIVHAVRLYRSDGSNADLCRRSAVQGRGEDARAGIERLAAGTRGRRARGLVRARPRGAARRPHAGGRAGRGRHLQAALGGVLRHRARGPSAAAGRLDDGVLRLQLPQLPADVDLRGERDFRVVLAEDAISGLYERGGRELEGIGVRLMLAVEIADAVA
jgi:hypothetical protein